MYTPHQESLSFTFASPCRIFYIHHSHRNVNNVGVYAYTYYTQGTPLDVKLAAAPPTTVSTLENAITLMTELAPAAQEDAQTWRTCLKWPRPWFWRTHQTCLWLWRRLCWKTRCTSSVGGGTDAGGLGGRVCNGDGTNAGGCSRRSRDSGSFNAGGCGRDGYGANADGSADSGKHCVHKTS